MPSVSIVRTLCVFHLAKSTGIASGRPLIIILLESSAAQSSGDADMAGPAAYFLSQGVTGQDLMTYTSEPDFARDLALTPFVARKGTRLRDEHLSARS